MKYHMKDKLEVPVLALFLTRQFIAMSHEIVKELDPEDETGIVDYLQDAFNHVQAILEHGKLIEDPPKKEE